MQVRSDRGLRTLQDVRDLGDRKILEVEQHDRSSLGFGERLDRGDEVDVRDGILDLAWLVPLDERSDLLSPCRSYRHPDGDPAYPSPRALVCGDAPPTGEQLDEGVLGYLFGAASIPEDQLNRASDARVLGPEEPRESLFGTAPSRPALSNGVTVGRFHRGRTPGS